MSEEIVRIEGFKTWPLRQKVLKPFASESECAYPNDNLSTTHHFGLYVEGELKAIATFLLEDHPELPVASKTYRLRGMAVDADRQGRGYGQKVLQAGLDYLQQLGCELVWCNARVTAFSFYGKMGFIQFGPLFELPGIGPHKVMYKNLIPR